MLEDVIQLHRAGQLAQAEDGYRQLLAEHPDDAEVLHLLGILRGQRGDVAGGLALVARAGELAPDDAACQYTLGEMQLSQGQLDAAERAYEQARQLNPNLAAAHGGLGQIALLRGDIDAAETHFKVALRADENDVQAITGLGNVANARGDAPRALQLFTQAAELAPDDPLIQTSYARAMLEQGMLDFASRALDNALAAKPDYPLALALRADVHVQKGEMAEAQVMYAAMLARGEQVAQAHAGLGDIARAQRHYDVAVAEYDQALALQPALHHVAIRRADALGRGGHAEQAIDALRQHIAAYPDATKAYIALATFLSQTRHVDDALAVWDAAQARWPADHNIKALHALELDRAGRTAEAVALADQAAGSPRPRLALVRARAALLAGDPAAAVQRLQAVDTQRLEKTSAEVRRRYQRILGLAFDALEQWPEAVDAFMQAQRLTHSQLRELPVLNDADRAALAAIAAAPPLVDARGTPPVLLCGAPGSGVAQVAALLADQPGWLVRRDRFNGAVDFIDGPFEASLAAAHNDGMLAVLARRYQRPVERAQLPAGTRIIDWLPVLDARVVPALKRALPGTRLIVVAREPHDMFMDWLAFGWSAAMAMPDLVGGARWLRAATEHLQLAARWLPTFQADPDVLLATGSGAARRQLAEFLGLDDLAWGSLARGARKGRGGLPTSFPAGHADPYREVLAEAFDVLLDA